MNPRRIEIEGPDASGKTSHAEALARTLGVPVVHFSPPRRDTVTDRAREYRKARLSCASLPLSVSARWHWSTLAEAFVAVNGPAQSPSISTELAEIWGDEFAAESPCDRLVIVLDAPDAVLDGRLLKRGETPDEEDIAFREFYRLFARSTGFRVVDNARKWNVVQEEILLLAREWLRA